MGAFIASREMMSVLAHNPVLGHLTTFGGHPVCCAAGMASLQVLLQWPYKTEVDEKGKLFISLLEKNPHIVAVRGIGLLIAIQLRDSETVQKVLALCLHRGLFSDWFLFAPDCIRIAPPLSITKEEIVDACVIINEIVDSIFIGA
jgi:acetylornithine/succinyldiaminopimelate/putrescine aminotransferase